ncbi:KRR1 small subunit processome component homolog [Rosa chinensis]|uniref:KRR1 small subunit processome component homolog n=1 Tax=Rosa chinensis TaxID=74649 RepID=UPI001AD8D8D0|nr:KRR1 small subunit processome component homolog [Rosa chinensis]
MSKLFGAATQLYDDWSIVESCLQKHDISCKLVAAEFYITVSVTTKAGESKILDVLKLLSVGIPPSKAIQVLEGSMYYDFIRTGSQYGGFCLKYGITKEQFDQVVWPRVEHGLEFNSQWCRKWQES